MSATAAKIEVCGTGRVRRVAGTDWPIEYHLYRHGDRIWVVAEVCNGTAEGSRQFQTRREARDWVASRSSEVRS